jgi:ArsR family transcriptional regulator
MNDVVQAFQALGDGTRLRLLKAVLSVEAETGPCVCELVDALRLPQYQVSRHLQQLKSAGWLRAQHRGTWVYYSLAEDLALWQWAVLAALRDQVDDPVFQEDAARLHARLALRQGDLCVIGYSRRSSQN